MCGDKDRLLYWPKFFLDHSSTSFSSWLGCSTVGHWGPKAIQSASWFSRWHPVSNWLEPPGHLVILFSYFHLLLLFFRLFTQVHLLTDGSVEGQYITQAFKIVVDFSNIHHVLAIHLMRWLTNFYDFRFEWTDTTGIGIPPTKAWLSQLVNLKNPHWPKG